MKGIVLSEGDITDPDVFDALLKEKQPDAVIHCQAMTAMDKCESKIDLAYKVNAFGTANAASECHRNGIRLIAISADCVFDDDSDRPCNEFDRPSGDRTIYGKKQICRRRSGPESLSGSCDLPDLQTVWPGRPLRRARRDESGRASPCRIGNPH